MTNAWRFAAAAVLAAAGAAWGMVVDIPLPILAARSELIVVGTVTDAGEAAEMEVKDPDAKQVVKAWYCVSTVKVTRVIRHVPPAGAAAPTTAAALGRAPQPATRPAMRMPSPATQPAAKIDTVRVIALAPPPRPAGAGPGPIMADGPFYANLRKGQSYVLILRRMPGREEYFLPAYFKNCRATDAQELADVQAAADVDKWPWGQAKDALQLALLPVGRTVELRAVAQRVLGPDGRWQQGPARLSAYVQCVAALRNVSDKPVAVSLYPEDRFLKITATEGKGGEIVAPGLYEPLKRMDLAAFGATYVKTLHPKAILFIGPMGPADYGTGLHMPLTAGKWQVRASFTAKRDAIARDATDTETGLVIIKATESLWTGTIESAPAEVEVSPSGAGKPRLLGPPVRQ